MISENETDIIAAALWTQDITDLSVDELDELAMWQFAEDPEVELDWIGLSQDAGPEGHGVNTEEEMMYTWSDYAEPDSD